MSNRTRIRRELAKEVEKMFKPELTTLEVSHHLAQVRAERASTEIKSRAERETRR